MIERGNTWKIFITTIAQTMHLVLFNAARAPLSRIFDADPMYTECQAQRYSG